MRETTDVCGMSSPTLLVAAAICVSMIAADVLAVPKPQCPTGGADTAAVSKEVSAKDIPIAHTPPGGGYKDQFPQPVLAACTEPLAPGAPDLRGVWKTLRAVQAEESSSRLLSVLKHLFWKALGVERERHPVPAGHPINVYAERIEQCGNRIVDMGGG